MTGEALTVVLPVHNGMPYLGAALQSILRQTFSDFKVIAIDDGSTDGSGGYLDTVRDERLTVIHQECTGLGTVLNRGIDMCQTPFLARMDADDISLPTRFEQQMARLVSNSELVAIGSPLNFLVHDRIQRGLPYPIEHDAITKALLRGESSFSHPTLLMRTAAASATRYRIGGAGEDLDFCLRLSEYGMVANLETPQYLYRLHESSISMTRHGELERGYSYAKLTALQRREGLPETPLSVFVQDWNHRSLCSRIRTRRVSLSVNRYRRARLAWAQGSYFRSAVHLSVSLTLQPLRAVKLSLRRVSSRLRGRTLTGIAQDR